MPAAAADPRRPTPIDGDGARSGWSTPPSAAGVRRFVLVSVFMDAGPRPARCSDTFENYMRVKRASDVHLAASGLDWTILRPGTLDRRRPAPVAVRLGAGHRARAPSAATTSPPCWPSCCTRPGTVHQVLELTEGDTPVADAVSAVARA